MQEVLHADSHDPDLLDAMASKTRVVLNCAGPFVVHGPPVIEACIRAGTHYCDITGEGPFVQVHSFLCATAEAQALTACGGGFAVSFDPALTALVNISSSCQYAQSRRDCESFGSSYSEFSFAAWVSVSSSNWSSSSSPNMTLVSKANSIDARSHFVAKSSNSS